jgi:hypothetical protein
MGPRGRARRWPVSQAAPALAAALVLVLAFAPRAAPACALELVLALDVSGSVDGREHALQMGGLAAALTDAEVVAAVERLDGGMLVTGTQWSGAARQHRMIGWHRVEDRAGLARLAAAIEGAGRAWRSFSTGIGEALAHARAVSAGAPLRCARRVIDVSGDGVSNEGRPPGPVARALAAEGYVINGLVIRGAEPDPVLHYEAEVIAGPGAFVEVADDFADYADAMRRKLLREIEGPLVVSEGGGE